MARLGDEVNIYNIMEGLHVLSKAPDDAEVRLRYLEKLEQLFKDYQDPARFNLVRHFHLLPGLCAHAEQIASGDDKSIWRGRMNEAILFLIGSQSADGSWGYYPGTFFHGKVKDALEAITDGSISATLVDKLAAMCNRMRAHYQALQTPDSKASGAVVWTAYVINSLIDVDLSRHSSAIRDGYRFLIDAQHRSGGWGYMSMSSPNVPATCIAVATLLRQGGQRNSEDGITRLAARRGLEYIIKQLKRNADPPNDDIGAGRDLTLNSKFTFSVPACVVEALSTVVKCGDGFFGPGDESFATSILDHLREYSDKLLSDAKRGTSSYSTWELRVVLESLEDLYRSYCEQISVLQLADLPLRIRNTLFVNWFVSAKGKGVYLRPRVRQVVIYLATVLSAVVAFAVNVISLKSAYLAASFGALTAILAAIASWDTLHANRELR